MDQDTNTPVIDDKYYTADEFLKAVDLSAWDAATICGSCHVGGSLSEMDRNGMRLSMKNPMAGDPGAGDFDMDAGKVYNAFNNFAFEMFDPNTGEEMSVVSQAPWAFPNMDGMTVAPIEGVPYSGGWGYDGMMPGVVDNQIMIPNVKEMDCLFCHLDGYQNLMSSVMTYSGMLFAAPAAGSGIMDTNSMSPTMQGYTVAMPATTPIMGGTALSDGTLTLMGQKGMVVMDGFNALSLSDYALSKIEANPKDENCMQCHAPSGLKDLPDMMRDYLSSAPMVFNPNAIQNMTSFTGLEMPAFDFNAPMGNTWNFSQEINPEHPMNAMFPMPRASYFTSPAITGADAMGMSDYGFVPSIGFPSAMGATIYNTGAIATSPMGMPGEALTNAFLPNFWATNATNPNAFNLLMAAEIGGGNPAGTGPLYYEAPLFDEGVPTGYQDQNILKKSVVPFPKAEWFKRGDLFGGIADDIHFNIGCAGCHYDTNTTKVDVIAEDGSTTFDGKSLCDPGRGWDALSGIENGTTVNGTTFDSNNTVKECVDCHINGTNTQGVAIGTFSAPNPDIAHGEAGLLANMTQAFGKDNEPFIGNHLDVMDCTVCHIYRKQMAVRSLDSTSGNRYPNMLGFAAEQGMFGMFSNPMGLTRDMFAEGAAGDAMFEAYAGDYSNLTEWRPLYLWMKTGDYATGDSRHRAKLFAGNIIDAIIWNNFSSDFDGNGDGVVGQPLGHQDTGGTTIDGEGFEYLNYDPPISRDMKGRMNYGPSGFANIPVGFGGGAFASAYAADGTFTGQWNYVGVYGGNAVFSTPEEVDAYLSAQTTDGFSWKDRVKYSFVGAPFTLTHNVRSAKVGAFVLGERQKNEAGEITGLGCSECHSAAEEFFSGTFDMIGTAIKAPAGGNFMVSGAEQLEIVTEEGDMFTGAELGNKLGQSREVPFHVDGCWTPGATPQEGAFVAYGDGACTTESANAGYRMVGETMERSKAMYPEDAGMDGTGYKDLNGDVVGDGSRAAWVAYLEDEDALMAAGSLTETAGEIAAIVPTAAMTITSGATFDVNTTFGLNNAQLSYSFDHYTAVIGTELTLTATDEGAGYSYYWQTSDLALGNYGQDDFRDGSTQLEGATATYTFNKLGTFTITLTAVSPDGTRTRTYAKVTVVNPASNIAITPADLTAFDDRSVTITFDTSGLSVADQAAADQLVIYWGDGKKDTVAITGTSTAVDHDYMLFSGFDNDEDGTYTYKLSVYTWDSANNVKVDMKKTATVEVTLP